MPVDVTRSNWECTVAESSSQRSEIRDQNLTPDRECEIARRRPSQSRRDEIFIDDRDGKFLGAPLGAKQFRSYGATGEVLNSGSINIQPLCGWAKSDAVNPSLRLGLLCVRGLREEAGRAIVRARSEKPFSSFDDLHRRVPEVRKDELRKLAAVGALNLIDSPKSDWSAAALIANLTSEDAGAPVHRRDALWQVERVSRDPGPLYETLEETAASPLHPMTLNERLNADLRGTGITIGRHPMAHQRSWLDTMQVTCAADLRRRPNGMWVKVAGWVIVRQRPGTAKGFVFLSLEDESGIANIIVTPQLFETNRLALVNFPFLLIEGILQHQDNVVSVKARHIQPLEMKVESPGSHDFH
jgi:error-prone DNA polymerase